MSKFYNTSKYQKLRASVMRQARYWDELEAREGRHVPADTVHHIFPREQYPEYEMCRWNLIALSNKTHEMLHNRIGDRLSPLGLELLAETAQKNNIPISKLIMVIGLPGSGKTSYVKSRLKGGLAYDLDYLAGAFRLTSAHEELSDPARKMANSMAVAFANNFGRYAGLGYIILTAPTIEEFTEIMPDAVVICNQAFDISKRKDFVRLDSQKENEYKERIEEIREYCKANNIEVIEK